MAWNITRAKFKIIIYCELSDAVTEVWELVNEKNKVITPSLPKDQYYLGIALFPVHRDFCRKSARQAGSNDV